MTRAPGCHAEGRQGVAGPGDQPRQFSIAHGPIALSQGDVVASARPHVSVDEPVRHVVGADPTVDDRSHCLHRPSSVLVGSTMDRGAANRLQNVRRVRQSREASSRGIEGPLSDTIEFQLLGATEARRDGEPVPLSGARRRALVARLLLDADRVVRADALIEDVWDGSPRPAAMATLQSHISQLRKVLGDRLQSQAAGYVLRTDAVVVDAAEFERQAEAGAAQLSASDAAAARTTLRGAARGWHGRALQDVAERPWAQPEAARLEELRAVTIEHLLAARLEAGEHDDVVVDAESAVAEAPLREQRWAVLMLALYRSGRQADALRAYRRLRTMLADELGIDPSPPLAQLEAAILQHDPALIPASLAAPAPGPASTQPRLAEARAARPPARVAHGVRRLGRRRRHRTARRRRPRAAGRHRLHGRRTGDVDRRPSTRDAKWLAAGEPARAAIAALLIVGNHYVRNRPAIAAGWFHKGRRLLEDQPEGPAHGVLAFTAALIAMAQGHPAGAADAALQAQTVGRRFGNADIEHVGLTLHGCALVRLGRIDEAQPMLDEALASAASGQLGPIATGQIFCWSTQALLAIADFARAAEWIEAVEACGIGGIPGDCRVHRAEVLRAMGELERAEAEAIAARA